MTWFSQFQNTVNQILEDMSTISTQINDWYVPSIHMTAEQMHTKAIENLYSSIKYAIYWEKEKGMILYPTKNVSSLVLEKIKEKLIQDGFQVKIQPDAIQIQW